MGNVVVELRSYRPDDESTTNVKGIIILIDVHGIVVRVIFIVVQLVWISTNSLIDFYECGKEALGDAGSLEISCCSHECKGIGIYLDESRLLSEGFIVVIFCSTVELCVQVEKSVDIAQVHEHAALRLIVVDKWLSVRDTFSERVEERNLHAIIIEK